MRVFEYQLITDGDMSGDITGGSQQMVQMAIGNIAARFTGIPNGTLKLEISNDSENWTEYTNSDYALTTDGDVSWNLSNIGYQYIRVVYERNSGSGNLNVSISGKGV